MGYIESKAFTIIPGETMIKLGTPFLRTSPKFRSNVTGASIIRLVIISTIICDSLPVYLLLSFSSSFAS